MTDRRYLAPKDAAAYMGVSLRSFYEYVRPNVPAVTIGRRVSFDRADLDTWAEKNKEPAKVEPQRPAVAPPVVAPAKPRRTFDPKTDPISRLSTSTQKRLQRLRGMS